MVTFNRGYGFNSIIIYGMFQYHANNSITIKNISDGDIFFNFRGSIIDVASGQTSVISNIPKGTYNYSTTYTVPAGATGSSATGDMTGTLTMNAGTKIQFLYSSTLLSGTYTISVTISDSDNQSTSSKIALPGQNVQKQIQILPDHRIYL